MALILLRHTTPDVAPGLCYGRTDLPLAAAFEAEAEAVLARLPKVAGIVTSPLFRCRALAERIGAARGCAVAEATALIEMDFGAWEGLAWADIPRAELDAWAADFMGYDGHGGESVAALLGRVGPALDGLAPDTLVVCHAGVIKAALAHRGVDGAWDHRTPFGGHLRLS